MSAEGFHDPLDEIEISPGATLERTYSLKRAEILGVDGRRLVTLADSEMRAGPASFSWDGRDQSGRRVPAGAYFYRISANENVQSGRVVLIR